MRSHIDASQFQRYAVPAGGAFRPTVRGSSDPAVRADAGPRRDRLNFVLHYRWEERERAMKRILSVAVSAIAIAVVATPANAREIRMGMTGTFTGPAAALGLPYKQTSELFPSEIGGRPVKWIVLDDGGDPSAAVKNARRFIDEDKVDAILGSTSPPGSIAMFDVATESRTPQLSLAPVPIPDAKRTWIFNVPQAVPIMVS